MSARTVPLLVLFIQLLALGAATTATVSHPALLPLCGMAYVLGLRHALDADHIAAIDNVSRNLMGRGKRATAVGLHFALGHSAAVALASVVVSVATIRMSVALEQARSLAAIYSTLISVTVLVAVAPRNAWAAWRIHRCGAAGTSAASTPRAPGGLAGRLLRPLLRLEIRDWQMVFVGALFGLGFETATAIAVLALSAAQVNQGMPAAASMAFPLLFTAGMTLVDALDGIFMERAYGWALRDPVRHARYNLAVTALSAGVALFVGAYELVAVLGHVTQIRPPGAALVDFIEAHFEEIGASIVCVFAMVWIVAAARSRSVKSRAGRAPIVTEEAIP